VSDNVREILTAALIMAAVLLSASACSSAPTPSSTNLPISTIDQQAEIAATVAAVLTGTTAPPTFVGDDRPTLPPAWTPTFTPLPPTEEPPTATLTPSRTPTVTPTLSAEAICAAFYTTTNLKPGQIMAWNSKIALYMNAVPPDAKVRFLAVQHFSKKNIGADLPGGQSNILQLPVKNLPELGQYDWTLVVKIDSYGDICKQSGWFLATGPTSTRAEESQTR
jgi:hypothetical protein